MGTAALGLPVEARFSAIGVDKVAAAFRGVAKQATDNSQKIGGSMRQVAGAIEQIARSGQISGDALKQVLAQGAEMATMFGGAGAIVGAIAITGQAIYEHITGNLKKAAEEAKKTRQEIASLATSGDMGGLKARARDVLYGTPFDAEGRPSTPSLVAGAFRGSLLDLRSRMKFLKDNLGNPAVVQKEFFAAIEKLKPELDEAESRLRAIWTAIDVMKSQPAENAIAAVKSIATAPPDPKIIAELAQMRKKWAQDFLASFVGANGVQVIGKYQDEGRIGSNLLSGAGGMHATVAPLVASAGQEIAKAQAAIVQQVNEKFGTGMHAAIVDAFTEAFSGEGFGGLAKGFIKTMMNTLGDIAISLGAAMIPIGEVLSSFTAALLTLSGPTAVAAGIAMLALGAAFKSGASSIGRDARSSGGGSAYSSTAPAQIIDRGVINPNTYSTSSVRPTINAQFTIIGQNDPRVQREIGELLDKLNRR